MSPFRLAFGDLAQANLLRGGQTRLKADLARLADELTTGKRAGPHPKLGGDLSPLMALERSRAAIAPWQGAAAEARLATEAIQSTLTLVAGGAQDFATKAIGAAGLGSSADIVRISDEGRALFGQVVTALNGATAGRSLFAGSATDSPALIPADDILDQIALAAAGATTSADVLAAVDAYFAPGGAFDTAAYLGQSAPEIRVGPADTLAGLPTAGDPGLRDTLAGLAVAALAGDPGLALSATVQEDLAAQSGTRLLAAGAVVVDVQARIGAMQQRIEMSIGRLGSEAAALDMAISELTSVDPYEAAAQLEATQVQLQTLYAVTARLSTLGLAGYLR